MKKTFFIVLMGVMLFTIVLVGCKVDENYEEKAREYSTLFNNIISDSTETLSDYSLGQISLNEYNSKTKLIINRLNSLKEKLETLNPPKKCELFHTHQLKAMTYMKLSLEAGLDDIKSMIAYLDKMGEETYATQMEAVDCYV